jgi:hypothetical protein
MKSKLRWLLALFAMATCLPAMGAEKSIAGTTGKLISMSEADRLSYKAGPSPLDSSAQGITLNVGWLDIKTNTPAETYDLVVYGATAGGIPSAVAAAQENARVIVLEPSGHVGGMLTGGLGWTDKGIETSIGGLSRRFYQLVYEHYQKPEAWRWETRHDYLARGKDTFGARMVNAQDCVWWAVEPSVSSALLA